MTIIVYDAEMDQCFADRMHSITGSMRAQSVDKTKVHTTADGHKFASSGSGSETIIGMYVDRAMKAFGEGIALSFEYEKADECSIVVRAASGAVFLSATHADGHPVLYPATDWGIGIPWARGAGGTFFDAYWQEHRDTIVALDLTLKHAYACGYGYNWF